VLNEKKRESRVTLVPHQYLREVELERMTKQGKNVKGMSQEPR
jgi:hypothetical protein